MKKILYSIFILTLLSVAHQAKAQAPNFVWAKKSNTVWGVSVSAVAVDVSGNSYITGVFNRIVTFGSYTFDAGTGSGMFLVKYDSNGNVLWAKSAQNDDRIASSSLKVDASGNIYLAGSFYASSFTFAGTTLTNSDASTTYQDSFLIKLNASGNALWGAKWYPTAFGNDYIFDLDVDASGNIYLAGGYYDSVSGSRNIFIDKVSPNGAVLWTKSAGGTGTDQADNISVDSSGNIYVAGTFDSSSITLGTTTLTNVSGVDMFLAKYNAAGTLSWTKLVGNTNDVSPSSAKVDANGNFYVLGCFNSPTLTLGTTNINNAGSSIYTPFLVKYDTNANVNWVTRPTGGVATLSRAGLAIDNSGNSYITGAFSTANILFGTNTLANVGNRDVYIAKYNNSGTAVWALSVGNSLDDYGTRIALGPSGNCHVIGNFVSESLTFGSALLVNQGSNTSTTEMFLTKLDNTNLSVDEITLNASNIQLYPNPVHRQFELSAVAPIQKVEVYSMLGQLVKSFNQQNQYDVSDLKKGSYIVKVSAEHSSESKIILID
ncbi:T9SS type A sorting domain-containing protein [Flavobacterium sp. CYK-55]|uniref:T9SS type A sorting domain-containing protein n=1 Tax=Flavobacterium sp. CYK-55 TaxID=2835529 RepID=UPI001BCBC9D9|nr:T9SS type A sorting domain-containing protein [Flavobacterium sp. CYK-55]MBS7787899.1 T9SS type A sorting domain-containing protein [Flavobacterium sp. CYK-55]